MLIHFKSSLNEFVDHRNGYNMTVDLTIFFFFFYQIINGQCSKDNCIVV